MIRQDGLCMIKSCNRGISKVCRDEHFSPVIGGIENGCRDRRDCKDGTRRSSEQTSGNRPQRGASNLRGSTSTQDQQVRTIVEHSLQNSLADDAGFHDRMSLNSLLPNLLFNRLQGLASALIIDRKLRQSIWKRVTSRIDGID